MADMFESPLYSARLPDGTPVIIDVTNSISSGLEPNSGMIDNLVPWMRERGYRRVLDFGAGALRHTIPLLRAGFEVVAVEYERAFGRPKAAEQRKVAERFGGFTALVWPDAFLKSKHRFDVALVLYVLQVIPARSHRELALGAIAKKLDRNGPRRLYYASRYGEASGLPSSQKYKDGWIRGQGAGDRSFYTEWNAADTDRMFARRGFDRAGSYSGAGQPFIYDYKPGIL